MASIMQMVEVRQAKKSSRKKTVEKSIPNFICAKMVGSVINTSGGPIPASILKEAQAGKMIKPKRIAARVSPRPTMMVLLPRDFFLSK